MRRGDVPGPGWHIPIAWLIHERLGVTDVVSGRRARHE